MLEITKKVFTLFQSNYILYCNWKGTSKIEDGLNGESDIDVLVDDSHKELAESLLTSAGLIKVRTQWICRFKDVYDWIGLDAPTGRLVHIHLHFRMIAGHPATMEYTLPWKAEVLHERVLLDNGIFTISPAWEIAIFLTRLGLEYPNKKIDTKRKTLKDGAKEELRYLQKRVDRNQLEYILVRLYEDDANEMLSITNKDIIQESDFKRLQQIVCKHLKGLSYNTCYRYISSLKSRVNKSIVPCIKKYCWIPQRKTLRKGITVAFLGQDGSGKSTVTSDVEKWFSWKIEVSRFYLGSGEEYYNPWQKRLLKKLNKTNTAVLKPIRYWLYFSEFLASAKYVWRTVHMANRYARNGGIALMDRFPQTQFVGINDGPKIRATLFDKVPSGFLFLARWYAFREEKYLDKAVKTSPTLIFKLMLSPAESLRRKPFEDKTMVERKHEIIKELCFPASQIEVVNAEQEYETELLQIKQILWEKLQG